MLGRTDSRRRLLLLLAVFVVGSAALAARLAYWQVIDRDRLTAEALAQTTVTLDTPSKRSSWPRPSSANGWSRRRRT
jgi:cell division protein FtsI/penicillin-binding protein 2